MCGEGKGAPAWVAGLEFLIEERISVNHSHTLAYRKCRRYETL